MKLKGKITILIGREGATIEIEDDTANVTFLKISLTPEQLSTALGRMAYTDCELDVVGLDKVGKKHENETFEFEIPPMDFHQKRDYKALQELAQSQLTDGWIADSYFQSQGSFFQRDGKDFARCTIRRWVNQ